MTELEFARARGAAVEPAGAPNVPDPPTPSRALQPALAAPVHGNSLCVVLHDVAPATLAGCERVIRAIEAVAPVPLTLLAVPRFHGELPTAAFEQWLGARSRGGDELALHGYTHLDEGMPRNAVDRLRRQFYTRGEGEFWALDVEQATSRLEAGHAWFDRNGWPLQGFVAPAWLLGPGAWAALRASRFAYTSTLRQLHLLPGPGQITSQSLVYSTSSAWRRQSSIAWARLVSASQSANPVLRIELHPHDADHAGVCLSWQRILEREVDRREALTVAQICANWRARHESATGSNPGGAADALLRADEVRTGRPGSALRAD